MLIIPLTLLLSCSQIQPEAEKNSTDYATKSPAVIRDTTGLIGEWHSTYKYYANDVAVILAISKGTPSSCPDSYYCSWTAKDNIGGNRGDYSLCANPENGTLVARGYLGVDGITTIIMSVTGTGKRSMHASIKYPNRSEPWELDFTR